MPSRQRKNRITDGTPVQVWLSKDLLGRFERHRAHLTDPATGRGPSRAALAETLIAVGLVTQETDAKKESAA